MIRIAVNGVRYDMEGLQSELTPLAEIHVSDARGPLQSRVTLDLPDRHVIEVELDNGIILFKRQEEIGKKVNSRSAGAEQDEEIVELPSVLDIGVTNSRAIGGIMVRAYRFFTGDKLPKRLTNQVAEIAARTVESQLTPSNADTLRHLPPDGGFADVRPGLSQERGGKMLVAIHGTASNTFGSFDPVFRPGDADKTTQPGTKATERWSKLCDHFDRVNRDKPQEPVSPEIYGFEHCTLTRSPVENAIALLEQLPERAELHLMTHSRGGLVGELIALGAGGITKDDLDYFGESPGQRQQLEDLATLLAQKKPKVVRFVRVAAPMRGTLLASDRLDRSMTLLFNLAHLVPGAHHAMLGGLRKFIQAVIATRKETDLLPGLEAMRPESALVGMLNRVGRRLESPLTVVGGDIEPQGVFRTLAVLATDLFYREDHDLIVNTAAMAGGAGRMAGIDAFTDRGSMVTHFSYWRNAPTAERIVRGLIGPLPEALPEVEDPPEPEVRRGAEIGTKPVVVVLPGITGSHLRRKQDDVPTWLNLPRLLLGRIDWIGRRADGQLADDVVPAGVIDRFYGRLIRWLSNGHRVVVFDYDWRRSIEDEADRLATVVGRELDEDPDRPVRLLGHSMGGLVARSMIQRHRDVWDRMDRGTGASLVMLGAPNRGSMSIVWSLLGLDKTMRQLNLLDRTRSIAELTQQINLMPGMLELLPSDGDARFMEFQTWADIKNGPDNRSEGRFGQGWEPPMPDLLERAKKTRNSLELRPEDAPRMAYIAGKAERTPAAIEFNPLRLMASPNGDGRVLWRTGVLPGVPTWYAPKTSHGDLSRDRDLFDAINDLLLTGETQALPQDPPISRGADGLIEVAPQDVLYPTETELEDAFLGGEHAGRGTGEKSEARACDVRICHGDLRMHNGYVTVGHYAAAPLQSAESELDIQLDGQLSRHRALGLYPETVGTAELFLKGEDVDLCEVYVSGALVIGLGQYGKLTAQDLVRTLTQGFLLFALRTGPHEAEGTKALKTLLIGVGDAMVSVSVCVECLLEGLHTANAQLPEEYRITELTILDLYEDIAIDAANALQGLANDKRYANSLNIDPILQQGTGGRRRHRYGASEDWAEKISITLDPGSDGGDGGMRRPETMSFTSLNGSARVARQSVTLNRRRLDRIIAEGTASTTNQRDVGRQLFQWLVPPTMKDLASDGRDLNLVLNPHAAAYPWEMLDNKWSRSGRPIAVDAQVVRQLVDSGTDVRPAMVATSNRALVIGDPESFFSELPNAKEEAHLVSALLHQHGWRGHVELQTGAAARAERELTLEENQLLHFAGHGVHDWGPNHETGLIIGKKSVLEPEFVKSLPYVPQFVFLNCCFAGKIERVTGVQPDDLGPGKREMTPEQAASHRPDLAANLAVNFIHAGTKAVIAAGWEVNDALAALFARTFYEAFLGGEAFAAAVQRARCAVYEENPNDNTWSAYQCYGDPQFRLRRNGAPVMNRPARKAFVSASQATLALRNLQLDARFARTPQQLQENAKTLKVMVNDIRKQDGWSRDPELYEAVAAVHEEMGDDDKAIAFYERAVRRSPPRLSVDALESLLELRVRRATRACDLDGSAENRTAEREAIEAALRHFEKHEKIAETRGAALRQVRIGDSYLRYAASWVTSGGKARKVFDNLWKAHVAYDMAERFAAGQPDLPDAHAKIRRALTDYLIGLEEFKTGHAPKPGDMPTLLRGGDIRALVDRVTADLSDHDNRMPGFDRRRLLAEARLFSLLSLPDTSEAIRDDLMETYGDLFMFGGSIGRRMEVVSDLRTVARLLGRYRGANFTKGDLVSNIATDLARNIPDTPGILTEGEVL